MILDTNAVSAFLAGETQAGKLLAAAAQLYLPLGVIAEYQYGLRASRRRARLQSLFRRLEAQSVVLYPDRETADWYVAIRFELKQQGTPIPESDLWIAALARQHALEIASQDTHFDLVDRIKRRNW